MRKILFSEQQRQRMKRMYEVDGASLATIAMNFGVSIPLVATHLRAMGVAIKGRGRPRKKELVKTLDCDPVPVPEPEVEVVQIFDV